MQRGFATDLRGVFAGVFVPVFPLIFVPRFCGVAWCCIDLDVERGDMAIVYKNGINVLHKPLSGSRPRCDTSGRFRPSHRPGLFSEM
jgi:hypothetical protein